MPNSPTFYLTTPIYYVNARPHLGHTYTTVVSDAIARRKRALGFDTWFLTGTDEHGQKIERSAALANRSPKEFADSVSQEFRSLWDRMGLSYDDFIRTTEERHIRGVQRLFAVLRDRGFIYKGKYTGQYCVFDELYVDALPGAPCPDCGRPTETVSEENYFFKLSAFERKLLELYEQQPDFIRPETRRNEVLAFVRGGLKDLSISRSSFSWGVPVPGDEKHVIYVWMDALINYITAIGFGSDAPEDQAKFAKYWPADLHIIGKEISRFHCVYWPAFLMAAGLPLPKSIVAHGWLLFEQSKMSKSRGNIVRAETVVEVLGADALRYFLLREVVFGHDGSFSFDALVQRYNSDLANGYGNLVSRTLTMILRHFSRHTVMGRPGGGAPIPAPELGQERNSILADLAERVIAETAKYFDNYEFSRGLEKVWELIAATDRYITEMAPWKQLKAMQEEDDLPGGVRSVLYSSAEAIRIITVLLYPILPESTAKVWQQLGLGDIEQADFKDLHWGQLPPGTELGVLEPIFPRAEKDATERMQDIEDQNNAAKANAQAEAEAQTAAKTPLAVTTAPADSAHRTSKLRSTMDALAVALTESTSESSAVVALETAILGEPKTSPTAASDQPTPTEAPALANPVAEKITIDDFAKVELRVAQIIVAERIPKADKLLRLEVDLGYEKRQILAGIAEAYAPEDLIGRKVVIVANLAPRKMRGLESNGMIVAASIGEKGKPVLAGFLEDVEIGARLK